MYAFISHLIIHNRKNGLTILFFSIFIIRETQNSKGFAFITYSKREEAKRAIEKLNRHGFENLLLSVIYDKS